jgi:hypothetical protein
MAVSLARERGQPENAAFFILDPGCRPTMSEPTRITSASATRSSFSSGSRETVAKAGLEVVKSSRRPNAN